MSALDRQHPPPALRRLRCGGCVLRGELELFHAFGLAAFTSDWLSPLFTLTWGGLALLAAWALGRTSGRQRLTVPAVLVILGTTALIASRPGGAYNDVTCIALLLCSAAIFVHGGQWLGLSLGPRWPRAWPRELRSR